MLGLVLTLVAGALRTLSAPDRYDRAFGGEYDVDDRPIRCAAEPRHAGGSPRCADADVGRRSCSASLTPSDAAGAGRRDRLCWRSRRGGRHEPGRRSGTEPGTRRRSHRVEFVSRSDRSTARRRLRALDVHAGSGRRCRASTTLHPDGPTTTATVVGVFGGASELADGYVIALFSPALLDLGDVGLGGGTSAVQLAPGTSLDDLRVQLNTLPNGTDLAITRSRLGTRSQFAQQCARKARVSAILALFAVVAAVAVIGQLLARQYRMSEAERLALASIGMTRQQLIADPLTRAAVPIVVGTIGSAALAIACSGWFPTGFVEQIEPHPGVRLNAARSSAGPLILIVALLAWVATGHGARPTGGGRRAQRLRSSTASPVVFATPNSPPACGSPSAPPVTADGRPDRSWVW